MTPGLNPSNMDNTEALKRLVSSFQNPDGTPRPGAPNGPLAGTGIRITRVAVVPAAAAVILVPAKLDRRGMMIRNLDGANPAYYSSDPAVTDVTGGTLNASESLPLNFSGPIYLFSPAGATIEAIEIYG